MVVISACSIIVSPNAVAAPVLSSSDTLSTAGYFRLSWSTQSKQNSESTEYELQQAANNAFSSPKTIYTGPDEASVISGLSDQTYFYRVRANEGDWSPVAKVEVKHHPLSRAFGFFALGAVMFIATVVVLLKGARGRV